MKCFVDKELKYLLSIEFLLIKTSSNGYQSLKQLHIMALANTKKDYKGAEHDI